VRIAYKCTRPNTTNDALRNPLAKALTALEWLVLRRGPMAVGVMMGGMITSVMREAKSRASCARRKRQTCSTSSARSARKTGARSPIRFRALPCRSTRCAQAAEGTFEFVRAIRRWHRQSNPTTCPPNTIACRRRLSDAHAGLRQHQRGDDHDRGKGSGSHPRGLRGPALTPHLPHGPWPAWPSLDCASLDTNYPNRILMHFAG
jgi:hypothetical protein